ncbi:HNH endonuclease [Ralstonia mojiangensis]|uniref:HNH endonuclease n=1 Tax=Ralstonia mojiangensis TaxID=2953895 RepID=UPI0021B46D44|nr:HNH endonuclease [Ralstonia mojiangensis]MCT7325023.1 HNH endonuclease [Ralstonia mojiangensis]
MSTRLTLHHAIVEVLTLAGRPLPARIIADEVNRLGHYARRDGAPVAPNQIGARTHNYPHLFAIADGLIALASPSHAAHAKAKPIVRDYRALGRFFRALKGDEVTLHFTDIEEILDGPLQSVARRDEIFWQNSDPFLPKPDGHKWAHEWMKAGWRKVAVDLQQETVVFQRVEERPPLSVLEDLQPLRHELIYDILQRVPISVEAWHTTKTGRPVKNFKANPRFCYNWSYGSPEEGYAVCLWHENLHEFADGEVFSDTNYRAGAEERRQRAEASTVSDSERLRLIAQAERGGSVDEVIRNTFLQRKPLHVIICSRRMPGSRKASNGTSDVKCRELDSVTWSVEEYDDSTGACRIVRGPVRAKNVQADEKGGPVSPEERVARYMEVVIRQEQPAFRKAVFAAYGGRCAISGCDIPEALEAAHLRGRDWRAGQNEATDGILLRRDLHTLYDRGLLELSDGVTRFSPRVVHHYVHLEGLPVVVRCDI